MQSEPLVYVVDDNHAMTESLDWILGSIGLKSKRFTKSDHFLKEYNSDVPGCILIDVRMPKISGPELQLKLNDLKQLCARKNVELLVEIDGGVDDTNIKQLATAGANVFVAGNAVFSAPDPTGMIAKLKNLSAILSS